MRIQNKKGEVANPVLGYVVIAVALICGMVVANAMGVEPTKKPTVEMVPNDSPARLLLPGGDGIEDRRWVLGVSADATEAGYLIRSVQLGTAAHRVGLEKGDRVIAVDGIQIGYIGGNLVHMSHVLDRQGGQGGRVRLLVQNHRNRRLVSLRVSLRRPLPLLGH